MTGNVYWFNVLQPVQRGGQAAPRRRAPGVSRVEACEAVDAVVDAGDQAIAGTLVVRRYATHPDSAVRGVASSTLAVIADTAMDNWPNTAEDPPNWVFRWGDAFEHRFVTLRRHLAKLALSPRAVHHAWTVTAFAVTVVAVGAIVTHRFWLAAGLLAFRLTVSTLFGPSNFPFDSLVTRPASRFATVTRCLLSHAGDALLLQGLAWTLFDAGRTGWAVCALGASNAVLLATLYRVAALQTGVQLFRLQIERIFRAVVPVMVLIVAAGLSSFDRRSAALTALGLAAVTPVVYSLGEGVRTGWQLRRADASGLPDPAVSITVRSRDASRHPTVLRPGTPDFPAPATATEG